MSDLISAVIVLAAICLLSLSAGLRVGNCESRKTSRVIQVVAILLMAAYLSLLWNRPLLSSLLPTSKLIVLANWLPLWGSFFVGIYLTTAKINFARRGIIGALTLCLCGYSAVAPLMGEPPDCGAPDISGGILHYQSTPYTCSAACAASLLQLHDINATESELAELCLTRYGTHWMGLYRGLKLKTKGTPWDVVARPFDTTSLASLSDTPGILSLQLDASRFPAGVDHGFLEDCGHSVVYLKKSSTDRITVFDPSPEYGVEEWGSRVLNCIDGGVVVQLVPRNAEPGRSQDVARNLATVTLPRNLTAGL